MMILKKKYTVKPHIKITAKLLLKIMTNLNYFFFCFIYVDADSDWCVMGVVFVFNN